MHQELLAKIGFTYIATRPAANQKDSGWYFDSYLPHQIPPAAATILQEEWTNAAGQVTAQAQSGGSWASGGQQGLSYGQQPGSVVWVHVSDPYTDGTAAVTGMLPYLT